MDHYKATIVDGLQQDNTNKTLVTLKKKEVIIGREMAHHLPNMVDAVLWEGHNMPHKCLLIKRLLPEVAGSILKCSFCSRSPKYSKSDST